VFADLALRFDDRVEHGAYAASDPPHHHCRW
jgi:hypothetical protein